MLEAGLPAELHDALVALRAEWPQLAQELALGRLSPQPGLPEGLRDQLQALLSPDAARAAELRAECTRGFEGILLRLWPQLEVVVVRTAHGAERLYCNSLCQAECQGLPFYCPFYQAAGGEYPPCWCVPWPVLGAHRELLSYGSTDLPAPADAGASLCCVPFLQPENSSVLAPAEFYPLEKGEASVDKDGGGLRSSRWCMLCLPSPAWYKPVASGASAPIPAVP